MWVDNTHWRVHNTCESQGYKGIIKSIIHLKYDYFYYAYYVVCFKVVPRPLQTTSQAKPYLRVCVGVGVCTWVWMWVCVTVCVCVHVYVCALGGPLVLKQTPGAWVWTLCSSRILCALHTYTSKFSPPTAGLGCRFVEWSGPIWALVTIGSCFQEHIFFNS